MSDENHERERIIIESSILAVTLLFVIASIREVAGWWVSTYALYALSMVGTFFVMAAFCATLKMFLPPRPPILVLVTAEFGFFMGGLAGLIVVLFGIGGHQIGGNLDVSMVSAVVFMSVVTVLVSYLYHRLMSRYAYPG